jgi:hypothetical protein
MRRIRFTNASLALGDAVLHYYYFTCSFQGAMDLAMNATFYSQFLYGGVNITAFSFVANTSDNYRIWEQEWRKHKDLFPNLFPMAVGYGRDMWI